MRRERHAEEQIISILKEADDGMALQNALRRHGIAEGTFY